MSSSKSIFSHFQTQRLSLTPISMDGFDDFFEYSKNETLYQFLEFPPQKSREESKKYLQKLISRSKLDNAFYWFIKNQGQVIGTFGVHDIDWRKKHAEISYGLSPNSWGNGFFIETAHFIITHLFSHHFHRISAITRSDNTPSIKGLLALGFKEEGILRDYYLDDKNDKSRHNASLFSLLKQEFKGDFS